MRVKTLSKTLFKKRPGLAVLVGVGDWYCLFQSAEFPIDLIRIERLGVETVPDPIQVSIMLRMIGVVDRLQQVLVSDCSAYAFQWAGARIRKAHCRAMSMTGKVR